MANTYSLDLEASSSQYASITDASQSGLDITGAMTIMAWVKTESSGVPKTIISKYEVDGTRSFFANVNSDNTARLFLSSNGSSGGFFISNSSIPVGVWTHIAFVYTPSTDVKIYINGILDATRNTSVPASIFSGAAAVQVGRVVTTEYFDGLLKDVRVYSDVRTVEEIRNDMFDESPSDANLEANWSFNNVYTDSSGNGNDLTPSNSPSFASDVYQKIGLVQRTNFAVVGSGTTETNSFNCGSGKFLTVFIHGRPGNTVSGVIYGGVALTQGVHAELTADKICTDIWYLANPPEGDNDIVVTLSEAMSSTQGRIGAASWANVDKEDIIDATNTETGNGAVSTDITTVDDNTVAISCYYTNGYPITVTPHTNIYNVNAGDKSLSVSYKQQDVAGTVTFAHTEGITNERCHALMSLNYAPEVDDFVNPKVKLSGTFATKVAKIKLSGSFVEKPMKVKVGGAFQ